MGTFALIAGIVGGFVSAAASVINRKAQSDEQKKELNQKQADLTTGQSHLAESYQLGMKQAQEQTDQANGMLQLQAQQTEAARDRAITTASKNTALQDQLASAQIATLQIDAAKAEGQAVQAQASSGFRATGSAMNAIGETRRSNDSVLRQAQLQRNLSIFSNYENARSSFLSSEAQLESYRRQVENNNSDLRRQQESLTLQYRQNNEEYETAIERNNEDIEFINSDEYKWNRALGYASDIFGGISTGANIGNSASSLIKAFAG